MTVIIIGPTRLDYERYKQDLHDYIKTMEEIKKSLANTVHIRFDLRNAGRRYDENLLVEITPSDDLTFIPAKLANLARMPSRPTQNLPHQWFEPPIPELGTKYRDISELGKDRIVIEIADLRAGQSIDLLNRPLYLNDRGKHAIYVEISSKNSTKPICKTIEIDIDELAKELPPENFAFD